MSLRTGWVAVALVAVFCFCADVQAAEVKVGVFSIQRVLSQSSHGKVVKQRIESRAKELEAQFKPEQDALIAMQKEIQQKGSVWNEEVKAEKIREFQKKQYEFQAKSKDARFELEQLQGKEMEPFGKALQDIVKKIGESGGYSLIVEEHAGVAYFNPAIDLTDTITKRLDAALK